MELRQQITVNTVYRFVYLLLQFLVTLVISRMTGPEGLGMYSLVVTNSTLLVIFTSLGIPSGLMYHASTGDYSFRALARILYGSTLLQLILAGIGEAIFFRIRGHYGIWPSGDSYAGIMGILLFATMVISEKYYALYNGYQYLKSYNQVIIVFAVLTILALFIVFLQNNSVSPASVILVTTGMGVLQTLALGIGTLKIKGSVVHTANAAKNNKVNFYNYSIMSYLANAVQFLANRVDYWILAYFQGQRELGYYSLSVKISQLLLILPLLFAALMLPVIASPKFQASQLERLLRLMNSFNLAAASAMGILSFFLVPLLFGKAFIPSVLPLLILMPGIFFMALVTLLAAYFAGKGRVAFNLQNSALCFVLVLAGDFLLIPRFGSIGAALAGSLAYTVSGLYALSAYRRAEGYGIHRLFTNRNDIQWAKNYIMHLLQKQQAL